MYIQNGASAIVETLQVQYMMPEVMEILKCQIFNSQYRKNVN